MTKYDSGIQAGNGASQAPGKAQADGSEETPRGIADGGDQVNFAWRCASPGDRHAIVATDLNNNPLPYSVALVGGSFEAWHRDINPRGGYWGGTLISIYTDAQQARAACIAHLIAPPPAG